MRLAQTCARASSRQEALSHKGRGEAAAVGETMKANDKKSREDALRFGADRICLWRLCGKSPCVRARACRGDARVCAGLVRDWLELLDIEKRAGGALPISNGRWRRRTSSGPIAPGARRWRACALNHARLGTMLATKGVARIPDTPLWGYQHENTLDRDASVHSVARWTAPLVHQVPIWAGGDRARAERRARKPDGLVRELHLADGREPFRRDHA